MQTIRSALQEARNLLDASSDSSQLDAEVLLAFSFNCDRTYLHTWPEQELTSEQQNTFDQLIKRRLNGEPVAYITGLREFWDMDLQVSPDTLIPRPETEHLIEYTLDYLKTSNITTVKQGLSLLEIGTGSGNVCITLAKHLPQARIFSIDICSKALNVAKKNIDTYADYCDSVFLMQGDLLSSIHRERARFDVILSNPPYIPTESMKTLPEEVKTYEPALALNGGPEGTKIMENILSHAGDYLLDEGLFAMELGENQESRLLEKASQTGLYKKSWVLPDYAGKPRILMAVK